MVKRIHGFGEVHKAEKRTNIWYNNRVAEDFDEKGESRWPMKRLKIN